MIGFPTQIRAVDILGPLPESATVKSFLNVHHMLLDESHVGCQYEDCWLLPMQITCRVGVTPPKNTIMDDKLFPLLKKIAVF